jgi:hypothetical protein
MNAFKSLSDDKVEQAWIEANEHVSMTFDHPPTLTQDGGAAISEHVHRRKLRDAVEKEFNRRYHLRRETSGSATVWEKSYSICGGRDGTEVKPSSYHAMVGKNFAGWIRSSP